MTGEAVAPSRPTTSLAEQDALRLQTQFVWINLIAAIFLQRFGVILGGSEFYLCYPVFMLSSLMLLWRGQAEIRPFVLITFLACAASFTLSTMLGFAFPQANVALSASSLFAIFLYYAGFVIGPARQSPRADALRAFVLCVRICCVVGLVQYLLQFAGIYIFTLGSVAPFLKPILVEANYNTEGFVSYGSQLRRANGLFPLEPGALSQLIAIAVLIDVFIRKRFRFLPLYLIAYVLTYSGTGALSLGICLVLTAVMLPRQGKYLILYGLAAVPLLGLMFVAFPGPVNSLLRRTVEFTTPGTSGYLRFVAQSQAWAFFSDGWRVVFGSGPGAFERSPVYAIGSGSAAVKLFAEYGAVGLGLFATFLISAVWNTRMPIIALMMLVIYQFGGGNLLQPPILVLMSILCIWPHDVTRSRRREVATA